MANSNDETVRVDRLLIPDTPFMMFLETISTLEFDSWMEDNIHQSITEVRQVRGKWVLGYHIVDWGEQLIPVPDEAFRDADTLISWLTATMRMLT